MNKIRQVPTTTAGAEQKDATQLPEKFYDHLVKQPAVRELLKRLSQKDQR